MTRLTRHGRFLAALVLGIAVFAALPLVLPPAPALMRLLLGFDAFALGYLVLIWHGARHLTAQALAAHAEAEDEGMALIAALAALAVLASLVAVVDLMQAARMGWVAALAAAAAVPLGWLVIQTLAAFRYAHLHYARSARTRRDPQPSPPGLSFPPGAPPAGIGDFLYFSCTVGMTAQVSDIVPASAALRRAVLVHAVFSYFYNAVILALCVGAGLNLLG